MNNDIESDGASSVSGDSGIGPESSSVYSASLASSIVNYQYENGRRYHAYRQGSYPLPNDEAEQDRLDLHHHIFRLALGGALLAAPIPPGVQRALDFGTGTGIWAIDFADENPGATVIGTDLSPIQPTWVAPNCAFYVEDAESERLYGPDEAFDLIHGRGMGGSIGDWNLLYRRILTHLKPGGWCEMQEYETWIYSENDPHLLRCPNIMMWQELVNESAAKFGKKMNVAHEQKQNMIDAGFIAVVDRVEKIPIGSWAKSAKYKEIGKYQREHMCACIGSFTLALLTRTLGWSLDECEVLMAGVRKEFCDPENHLTTVFHFVYGKKPSQT